MVALRKLLRLIISLDAWLESRLLLLSIIADYLFALLLKFHGRHLTILILVTSILLCIAILIQLTIFFSLEIVIFVITALIVIRLLLLAIIDSSVLLITPHITILIVFVGEG